MRKHPDQDRSWLLMEADDKVSAAWDAGHRDYIEGEHGQYQECRFCGGLIPRITDMREEHRPDCIYMRTHDALVAFANAIEEADTRLETTK